MNYKTIFHYVSYFQYPLMLMALYFSFSPYLNGLEDIKKNPDLIFLKLNSALIFMGLGMSFSSLQDTTKTQNTFSEKVWKNPKKGKIMIIILSFMILLFLIFGLTGYYFVNSGVFNELSIGLIITGLGMFGFLKSAIEMFENHRIDKNTDYNNGNN